jgi:5'-nucleotidase
LKIVVTNDDGYDQPGLAALVEAVKALGEVTVVAPATPQSNVGHRVTMREPIRVEQLDRHTYVVHATPADCTRLAVKQLVPDVDWVVAGINPGANLGSDVYQSGTVAASREAAILGIRAAAISQYIAPDCHRRLAGGTSAGRPMPSGRIEKAARRAVLEHQSAQPDYRRHGPRTHRFCPLDKHPHRYRYAEDGGVYRYQGIIHDRPRTAGSDVDVCFGGMIAVTRMEI